MVECTRNASCRCADRAAAWEWYLQKILLLWPHRLYPGKEERKRIVLTRSLILRQQQLLPRLVEQAPKAVEPATKVEVAQPQPEPSAPKAETGSDVPPESFCREANVIELEV